MAKTIFRVDPCRIVINSLFHTGVNDEVNAEEWVGHRHLNLETNLDSKSREKILKDLKQNFDGFIKSSHEIVVKTMTKLFIMTWQQGRPSTLNFLAVQI